MRPVLLLSLAAAVKAQCGPLSDSCGPFIAEVRGLRHIPPPRCRSTVLSLIICQLDTEQRVGHPTMQLQPPSAPLHSSRATVLTARILPAPHPRRLRARRTTSTWCVTHDRLPIHRAEPK
jgi:hypothetical protein